MGPGDLRTGNDKCVIVLEVTGPMSSGKVDEFNQALNTLLESYKASIRKTYISRGNQVDLTWKPPKPPHV